MAKIKSKFICQSCAYESAQWLGKCPECGEWNSFSEEVVAKNLTVKSQVAKKSTPLKLKEISESSYEKVKSGIFEFDRVLGGGITKNSLILIGGEPGIGKSTLLTNVLGTLAAKHKYKILYVSGEESISQVGQRVKRLGIVSDDFYIYHESIWQNILEEIRRIKPDFLVLDSIQTTVSLDIQSPPGTMSQIREVTYELMNHVKGSDMTCFIVGHITKEGSIAGPKILEHMVDTVVYFEGDQFGHYRMLRSIKNRFGNTREVGIFEMGEQGLMEVKNPSHFFLNDNLDDRYGAAISAIIEGSRTLLIEIQALVVENKFGNGRRTTQGVDANRLSMMVAIIEKYFGHLLGFNDIYLNVVGGMRLTTRDSDLAIIAALLSSFKSTQIETGTVFIGEVGLTGEVSSVPQV